MLKKLLFYQINYELKQYLFIPSLKKLINFVKTKKLIKIEYLIPKLIYIQIKTNLDNGCFTYFNVCFFHLSPDINIPPRWYDLIFQKSLLRKILEKSFKFTNQLILTNIRGY